MITGLVVCLVALVASGLTLFSGFGLGTLLLPAFALFFPVPVAVAATAVVHLANNLFKLALVGKDANWPVVWRFALPGAVAAFLGAALLVRLSAADPITTYTIGTREFQVTPVQLVIGLVIVAFAILELVPRFAAIRVDRRWLPVGGALSGFFGGLSGSQGALRSMFLIKAGLDQRAYIGTSTVAAVIVDVSRLLVYGVVILGVGSVDLSDTGGLVVAATLSAFLGAYLGSRWIDKITMHTLQRVVAGLLIVVGLGLASGLL